jgi:hypothetical protein
MDDTRVQAITLQPVRHQDADTVLLVQGGSVTAAIFGIVWTLLAIRKRYFSDTDEIKTSDNSRHLMETIIAERNEAVAQLQEEMRLRVETAEKMGRLAAEVEGLRVINHKTNGEVHVLRLLNDKLNRELETLRGDMQEMKAQLASMKGGEA